MKRFGFILLLSFFAITVLAQWAFRLPTIISNHAVLQQSAKVKLWGWGQSGSTVRISCSWNPSDTVRVEPQKDWTWEAYVNTPKAGGPYTITFISNTQKVVIEDILIGEVWLCTGQSNMEYAFNWQQGVLDAGDMVSKSYNKEIRFFRLSHLFNNYPQTECDGRWVIASPETTADMSVAGYVLGKKINEYTKYPVGLIASYWGGTSVQAWIPGDTLSENSSLKAKADKLAPVNWSPTTPSSIYNAMTFPLIPYKVKGCIWYQGEGNTDQPEDYGDLFKALIISWREKYQNEFPFYFAQIAPWNGYKKLAGALLREQQAAALSLPKTGMINVSDLVDDTTNIHPKSKVHVGNRFADLILKECYGDNSLQPYSPKFKDFTIKKNKVMVSITSIGNLKCTEKEIKNFQLAGADHRFYSAKAIVAKNGNIVLISSQVKQPVAVRYCFTNTAMPNLFDTNGLPLLPFRTDDW